MTYEKITKRVIFVSFLWILQSIGRLSFAILGGPAGMGQFLDVSISYTTSLILFVMFILLGVFGFIAAFALLTRRKWGFLSTILVSIATIVFDIWGLTIQFTAAIGFIIPIISIIILYLKRN